MQQNTKEYKIHVEHVYKHETQRLRGEMLAIASKVPELSITGYESYFDVELEQLLQKITKRYNKLLA